MGLQQSKSKEELLYEQVDYGNIEGIRRLRQEGASLEWVEKHGKTPLILACIKPDGFQIAKLLVELGANIDFHRPGSHAGTALHHAAKRGNEQIVTMLLSYGANPLKLNDACKTPIEVAREKGHCNVVRIFESRIAIFLGWLREFRGPRILGALQGQKILGLTIPHLLATNKIWAVVLPCDYRNLSNPSKVELVIYPDLKAVQPSARIKLWKSNIENLDINQLEQVVVIFDKSTNTRYKLLSAIESDRNQVLRFYQACRGIRDTQIVPPPLPESVVMLNPPMSFVPTSVNSTSTSAEVSEDPELAMAINASIESAKAEGISVAESRTDMIEWGGESMKLTQTSSVRIISPPEEAPVGPCPSAPPESVNLTQASSASVISQTPPPEEHHIGLPPSAPPISPMADELSIHYPLINPSGVNDIEIASISGIKTVSASGGSQEVKAKATSSDSGTCVVCLDAPVEGACVPCGHMAGCMVCLNEIKKKNWGCPVCRANIDQVIKLFVV